MSDQIMPPQAVVEEAWQVWSCGLDAWSDYLARLATGVGPFAAWEAGAQLMVDGLEIFSRAAAARLAGSVATPLLNDA